MFKNTFRKSLALTAVAATLGLGSTSAMAVVFADFTVDENSVPLVNDLNATFVADKIVGGYVEVITFGAGTFDVSLRWNAGQYFGQDGTVAQSVAGEQYLGSAGSAGYNMYALYQGSGTFSTSSGVTTFITTAGSGGFSLYIDPDKDTTFVNSPVLGSAPWVPTGTTSDDFLIASGTPQSGSGKLDPSLCSTGGINCGSFGTSVSFELTADGKKYFTAPVPFYNLSFQSGQLNNFEVSSTQKINGSMDVVFTNAIPEPASLALLGVGLLGLGFSRRRAAA